MARSPTDDMGAALQMMMMNVAQAAQAEAVVLAPAWFESQPRGGLDLWDGLTVGPIVAADLFGGD